MRLQVELKNVGILCIKVFEFNTETYYKKNKIEFNDSQVNFDGLVASTERLIEDYKDRPCHEKHVESISLPELKDKAGMFIIEIIGNGVKARAVIKKGSLSLIHKPTIGGHEAYILDEERNICSGPGTGIFIEDFIPTQEDKGGKIFIPYSEYPENINVILIHHGFAELSHLNRLSESYKLLTWINLDPESIIRGNTAQVLVRPQLYINKREASIDLLMNAKVNITTNNYIDDSIPVIRTFENLKLKEDKDCVLEF